MGDARRCWVVNDGGCSLDHPGTPSPITAPAGSADLWSRARAVVAVAGGWARSAFVRSDPESPFFFLNINPQDPYIDNKYVHVMYVKSIERMH